MLLQQLPSQQWQVEKRSFQRLSTTNNDIIKLSMFYYFVNVLTTLAVYIPLIIQTFPTNVIQYTHDKAGFITLQNI